VRGAISRIDDGRMSNDQASVAEQLPDLVSDRVDVVGERTDDSIGHPVIEVADKMSR
jgi:hypothetical protein